ncbi:hypothetical protein HU230_0008855 [Bradyrhizobium quebecense]|uniref:Uncharacterized protein n=1 Tax=Bradyrhizobium quebecense TaxID=2748629 RepID=A0A973WSM2_9BRAD|nr:hypothetical protein [Bradyrhizobium quebecense]UGA46126.1 hypothetical protein HU230_0008855 [Bradyrhizobium quebecense]
MALIAQEMLIDPNTNPTPEMWRTMLERFLELLEQESARLPAHRPKTDHTGSLVTLLIEKGWSQADARQRVAKISRKSVATVARSHNRHRSSDKSRR